MNKKTLHKLKNAEHLLYMQQISALVTEANHEKINPLNVEFKKEITKSEEGQKQIRKSEHTKTLVELDKQRDERYIALNYRLEAEEKCPVPERKEAAKLLRIVLKTYGNPTKLNLIEETSVINNLLAELKQSKYEDAIRLTGLQEWISWLETANKEFFTTHEQRRDNTAGQVSIDVKAVRKQLDEHYFKIKNRISALVELEPSETLTTLVSKIEATIEKYKAIA